MKLALLAVSSLAALAVAVPASGNGGKVNICHKGKTLSVASSAVKAHLKHGDKQGPCRSVAPVATDPVVSADTFKQVNRVVACADRPVLRVADNSYGITVDLDLATWQSGVYAGVRFTIARYYVDGNRVIGASCDNLPGFRNSGAFVDSTGQNFGVYPKYVR